MIKLESQPWFYFTVDLDFEGYGTINFIRFIEVNEDRAGAVVGMKENKYFGFPQLILLPYESGVGPEYFSVNEEDKFLSVWTFDATKFEDSNNVDLKSEWPNNILDKAAITPYESVLETFGIVK